jgi:cytochrome c peroxidase
MPFRRRLPVLAGASALVLASCGDMPDSTAPTDVRTSAGAAAMSATTVQLLGQRLFEDERLSVNGNQSCRSCHEPGEGFAAALPGTPQRGSVVEGSVPGRFGDRKPPAAAYATLTPDFSGGNNPSGGLFWDGRATGWEVGSAAADQALRPFLNPVEQALPDKACVVYWIQADRPDSYAALFRDVFGGASLDIAFPPSTASICTDPDLGVGAHVPLTAGERTRVDAAYDNVARAIAAFEGTFNRFSSDFDAGRLTAQQEQGRKLFNSKGKCAQCHSAKGSRPAFTDFAFHNLGVPKNPANPVYGYGTPSSLFDPGLGGFTGRAQHLGKMRTPSVRNTGVGANRTFMHNGALISLRQVVDFYNTRDVLPRCTDPAILQDPAAWGSYGRGRCWPAPQHASTMDSKNMGKLGLSDADVDAVVAFMMALSDR